VISAFQPTASARLSAERAKLAARIAENAVDPDKGHSKAIEERMTALVWWPVASGDDAVVMVEWLCGWPCSRGMRVFLHRSGDSWQVVRHDLAGVS
jgi:hypothetical protein